MPQLATGSLDEITKDLRRYGWSGFSTRYWLLGDHEPCVAYFGPGRVGRGRDSTVGIPRSTPRGLR